MTRAAFVPFFPLFAGAATVALAAGPASAQPQMVSREVVQPLPAETSGDLTQALTRLSRDPKDVAALIDAGVASLELGDIDAALGFFGRAQELSPGNPRIKAGFGAAYARQQRPVEALRLFEEAEREGVSITRLAGERGLAYDLVGAGPQAQASYRTALEQGDDPEVRRRLALSYAISGQRDQFEATLRPLLDLRDPAAFRARAFGLAIMGDADGAISIVEAAMPREVARKLTPYLRYMPRLTAAQQAAAANLGVFPRATQIGHDDPRIASAADSFGAAEARLRPTGAPLGPTGATSPAARNAPTRTATAPSRGRRTPTPAPAVTRPERDASETRIAQAPRGAGELPPVGAASAPGRTPTAAVVRLPEEPAPAAATPGPSTPAASATPGFDLAKVEGGGAAPEPAPAPEGLREVTPAANVASAFGDLTLPEDPIRARPGNAVDITRIVIPRETAPEPEVKAEPAKAKPAPEKAKPAKPANPSRIWVQVATGKDRDALGWDWRRFSKKAGEVLKGNGPFVTPWGEANRLLAGPYDSRKAAEAALDKLREAGIDGFLFTSRAGEAIDPLD